MAEGLNERGDNKTRKDARVRKREADRGSQ